MLNLKSELHKKQKEIKDLQSASSIVRTAAVKDYASSTNKKVPHWLKKNFGVEKRNENDCYEEKDEKHNKAQAILEAKAKLYDKMTKGDIIPDSEDTQIFLVDFEQKSIDAWREKSERGDKIKPKVNAKVTSEVRKTLDDVKDQWVEYVDSLGRTRTVLKEDLPRLQKQTEKLSSDSPKTKTLMSDDMRRQEERLEWEKSAIDEMQNEVHYENLRFGEIRELGVGYFAFSGKQSERDEQMKHLDQLRKHTQKKKQEIEVKNQKRQSALTARLEKVRQRRIKQLQAQGKEIPASLLEPEKLEEKESFPEESQPEQQDPVSESPAPSSSKMREWDKGKDDWEPAKPPSAPKSWVNPREERPSEFAPPSFYYDTLDQRPDEDPPSVKRSRLEESKGSLPCNNDNKRIQRVLAEIGGKTSQEEKPPSPHSFVSSADNEKQTPYIPTGKPLSIKVISKPTKLLNTKSAFD